MEDYENPGEGVIEEQGFLDRAMEKLKGPSKKKKFTRGLIYGYGSSGYGIESIARAITKRDAKNEDYIIPSPSAGENKGDKSYVAGVTIGMIAGFASGIYTFGASYAAPHIAGFANRLHRKMKKSKKNGRY